MRLKYELPAYRMTELTAQRSVASQDYERLPPAAALIGMQILTDSPLPGTDFAQLWISSAAIAAGCRPRLDARYPKHSGHRFSADKANYHWKLDSCAHSVAA